MNDDILILFIIACAFLFGIRMGKALYIAKLARELSKIHDLLDIDSANTNIVIKKISHQQLSLEMIDNQILAYDIDTGDFVCQGGSLDLLASAYHNSYSKNVPKIGIINNHTTYGTFIILDGKIVRK